MQSFPLVTIVVLNYNGIKYLGEDFLKRCLNSIIGISYPNLEVIFVDNGSEDGSAEFVSTTYGSRIRVIVKQHNIIAEGYNAGIKAAKGKYIALVSNDMEFQQDWLKPIIKLMERDTLVGIAGGKRLVYGKDNVIDGIGGNLDISGRALVIGEGEENIGKYETIRYDLDYIGGAVVARREALSKTGLFDPDYLIFFEDVDLCFKMIKYGYKIAYVPKSLLWHKSFQTIGAIDPVGHFIQYMGDRSRIRFTLIHFSPARLLATLLIDLIFLLLSSIVSKKLLIRAYIWNLRNVSVSLHRRAEHGVSSSLYKLPSIFFS